MRGAARDRNHDGRKVAASGVRGIRLIASNADLAGILARLRRNRQMALVNGARQVGKTTVCRTSGDVYLN